MAHLRRAAHRLAVALLLVCLAALLGPGVVLAHPEIIRIEPPPDARLEAPPAAIAVTFSEPIEALSTLALYSGQGALIDQGGGRDPADPTRLIMALAPLEPGPYTVVWTAAGSDGHVVRGNFAFTVLAGNQAGEPAPGATPAPAPTPQAALAPQPDPPFPAAQALTRWALLLGATGAVGGWAFWLWAALPALGAVAAPPQAVRRWRLWSTALLVSVISAAPLLLARYVAEISPRLDAAILGAALGSRQGLLMLARVALAIALLGLTVTTADGAAIRRRAPAALGIGAALLLVSAIAGHAGAAVRPVVPVAVAWVHLVATSVWAGGLLLFAVALSPLLGARPAADRPALLRELMARFSPLAMASVSALAVSGAAAALREVPDLPALWLTPYGQILGVKLLLFAVMLTFGAFHLLVTRRFAPTGGPPTGNTTPWAARAARSIWAEGAVAILALAAAGTITSLAPPSGSTRLVAAAQPTAIIVPTVTPGPTRTPVPSRPFDESRPAGDLLVRLAVAPASLGENSFRVTVTDQAGQPVATQLVRLSFAMREMDMGEQILEARGAEGATVVLSGSPLSMVGQWEIVVLVRRAGVRDVTATFSVPVGE